jgi:hypothetical protein
VEFRDRLFSTLRAIGPVLSVPDVLVVGSEVPNLLEPGAAATLVVSQAVDVAVPVSAHAAVKARLREVRGLRPSPDEPSVWVPADSTMIEVNFIGMDPAISDPAETYVLPDPELPLLVFGALSFVRRGATLDVGGVAVPLPRAAGMILEKLVTDRTGEKGERDLLVVLALVLHATARDLDELDEAYRALRPELRHAARSNLSILSLMAARPGMPDPAPHRGRLARLLERLERVEGGR